MKSTFYTILLLFVLSPSLVFAQPFTLLKDINSGPSGSNPGVLFVINGTFLLVADDGINGRELWITDGTEPNTNILKDINPTGSSDPSNPIDFNGTGFFVADDGVHGQELWKTDGTEIGTIMVKDINPTGTSNITQFIIFNGSLLFVADDGTNGQELWKTDGTELGTIMVKDLNPTGSSDISNLTTWNNILIFMGDIGSGPKLWKTDGTEIGTIVLNNLVSTNPNDHFYLTNTVVFFSGDDGINGRELWKTDGSEVGTVIVKDIYPGVPSSGAQLFTILNQTLFFRAFDGTHGYELWKSDGTEAGTILVKDIWPGSTGSEPGSSSAPPVVLIPFNDIILFRASHPDFGTDLWKSDGTEAGTILLKDNAGFPIFHAASRTTDNGIFYSDDDGIHGRELWFSDGTEAGTHMVKDIHLGMPHSFAGIHAPFFISYNNLLYFVQGFPETGPELWRSDGTEAGTFMVKDIWPGPDGQPGLGLGVFDFNNVTFVNPNDGSNGIELWRTNGTGGGTELVQDFEPGPGSSVFGGMINFNGTVFAIVETSAFGSELWVSTLAALPVSILEFTGKLIGDHAQLNWKTQHEVKNSQFVLERSFDRSSFIDITTIPSKNGPGTNHYQFVDSNIVLQEKSVVYYRLKEVGPDGDFDYSSIVALRMSSSGIMVSIQPNPVKTQLRIELNSKTIQHAKLNILNMNGMMLMQKELAITKGSQFTSFDISRLPAGVYILSIKTDHMVTQEMFIKN